MLRRSKPRRMRKLSRRVRLPIMRLRRPLKKLMRAAIRTFYREAITKADEAGALTGFIEYLRVKLPAAKGAVLRATPSDNDTFIRFTEHAWKTVKLEPGDRYPRELSTLFDAGSRHGFAKLGYRAVWNLESPEAIRAIEARTNKIVDLESEQFERVRSIIIQECYQQAANPSAGGLVGRIMVAADKATDWEAERIARMESLVMAGGGEYTTYQNNGVDSKEWIYSQSGYERHEGLDGEVVPIDEPFSNGLMYPGDPSGEAGEVINCMCSLGPVVTSELADRLEVEGIETGD